VPISTRKSLRISPPQHRLPPPCIITTWQPPKSPSASPIILPNRPVNDVVR
jgi:hypothetical protein